MAVSLVCTHRLSSTPWSFVKSTLINQALVELVNLAFFSEAKNLNFISCILKHWCDEFAQAHVNFDGSLLNLFCKSIKSGLTLWSLRFIIKSLCEGIGGVYDSFIIDNDSSLGLNQSNSSETRYVFHFFSLKLET
jgi:hypothetical protein